MKRNFLRSLLLSCSLLAGLLTESNAQTMEVTYSQFFITGQPPTAAVCSAWNTYCLSLSASYTYLGFKIYGSADPNGISCTNATIASGCAAALRTNSVYGPNVSDGQNWIAGPGGGGACAGVSSELSNVGSYGNCVTGYTVRPAISNPNWGGINGPSCSNPTSQTMAVTFYIQSPVQASSRVVNFGVVQVSTPSVRNITLTGSGLASGGSILITPPANFEVSLNGSTWFSGPMSMSYVGTSFGATPLYVRFTPGAATTYNSTIEITGGGMPGTAAIGVLGTGAATGCSATPTAGVANLTPMGGTITTPFTLTLTEYEQTSGVTLQWQSSPNGVTSWTNIANATNATHNFTGISAATYYRCNVTCTNSSITAASSVISATLLPSTPCAPGFAIACPSYNSVTSIASLIGEQGSSIIDPQSTCTGNYQDNSGTHHVTLYKGLSYTNMVSNGTSLLTSMRIQMWIDFNNNGVYEASEVVGGTGAVTVTPQNIPITIPIGAPTGTFRMRLIANYSSPTYPSIQPCPTSGTLGHVRDYKMTILAQPSCAAPPPAPPTALTGTSTISSINGSFSAAVPGADGYLVVMTTTSVAPTPPTNGITYSVGASAALGGTILSVGTSTTFSATGLSDGTPYWFWVYPYKSTCSGGTPPIYGTTHVLNGTFSTLPCAFAGPKTVGPGGDYPTIAAAVTAINTLGLGIDASIEILPAYTTETFPITISSLLCQSNGRTLTIRPHSSNEPTMKTITGSISGPMISLNGARNVIIDGRVGSTGTTKMLTLANTIASATTTTSTIQFINDACDNKVQYMTLKSSTLSTAGGVVLFSTSTGASGNDRDTVDNCDISEATANLPYNGIYAAGTTGKENNSNVISNNNISNFFVTSSNSSGIAISTGNSEWLITGNRIFQSTTRALTTGTMRGIWINNTTSGNGFVISDNTIGASDPAGTGNLTVTASTGSFRAISCNGSYVIPNSIQGNTITNISLQNTTASTTGQFYGIDVNAGSANIGTTTGNIIGSATGTGAITRIISLNGSANMRGIATTAATPGVVNIANNIIGGITLQSGSTATGLGMYGIEAIGTAATTITGNTIGSATTANSIATSVTTTGSPLIYGIYAGISSATPVNPMVTDNVIANITTTATGTSTKMAGIYFNTSNSSSPRVLRNTISSLTSGSSYTALSTDVALSGITMYTGNVGTPIISQNTVNALSMTNTTASVISVTGILYTTSLNGTISGNRIYDLRNAGTQTSTTSPPKAIGIFCYLPSTSVSIYNNMITLGMGTGAPSTNTAFNGINANQNSSYIFRCYHNTVYIGGTATSGSIATACLHRGSYSGGSFTAPTMDVRNNIFVNNRTGATNQHYAIANCINYTSNITGWSAASCNYNILNSANTAAVGWWSAQRDFANWKTASSNCDLNSFSGSTLTFADIANGDLHINMGTTANDAESHCNIIPGYTTDYDNETRPGPAGSVNGGGAAPDMGADEFDGVANINIGPAITYSVITCGNTSDYVFTATIAHPSGVANGALAPRVYYRKGAVAFSLAQSSAGVLTSGDLTNGVWTFTVSASVMGGLAAGNTVNFFVIAQSSTGLVASNTSTGMVAANVNSISAYPTNSTLYTVGLSGTYTVGNPGGNYLTLTAATADYNARCLGGPVTFSLISSTYASESIPILINNITWANPANTLLIRPADGVNATITSSATSNAQIKILQAKYVTIDGINSGGTSLTLNNTYTGNNTSSISICSNGTGVSASRNITIRNLNINGSGAVTTSSTYGIIALSNNIPQNTTGADNDTITIEGNNITRYYYGIYATGTSTLSAGGLNDWIIRNNIIGPATFNTTTNIGFDGIFLSNMLNLSVTGNTIRNVGSLSATTQAVGLYLNTGINGYTIDSNDISGIASLSSSSSTSSNAGMYIGTTVINGFITRNKIRDISSQQTGTSSARGITCNISNTICNLTIANNMISDIRTYGTTTGITAAPVGLSLDGTHGYVKVYHNTISLNGTNGGNGATTSACFYTNSTSNNIDFRNNILINRYNNAASATDKGYAFYTTSANSVFSELDYNNYYVESPSVLAYTSGDRVSLALFQSAFGRNVNSKNINTTFVSVLTDLHLSQVAGNMGLVSGTYISTVPKDIDNVTRNIITPVIGAHEVAFCPTITAGTVNPAIAAFCTSGMTTINSVGATAGESMQWRSSTDSATWTTIAGATTASYVLPSSITTTTYYRLVNKCSSSALADSATTKVTINPVPAAITGTLTVCMTGSTTLNSVTADGTWISGNTGAATINSTTGVVTPVGAGTSIITYRITATGCESTAVLTVNALPTLTSITTSSSTLCVGATVTLNATGATGTGSLVSYNWSGPNTFSTTTAAANTSLVVGLAAAGEYSLSVTYPGAGCTSTSVMTNPDIIVNALPTIGSITTSSTLLCTGTTLTLNALTPTGTGALTSYNWSGPNSFSTTSAGSSTSLAAVVAGSGEYSVSVTYPGTGCTSTKAMTDPDVIVNVQPVITSLTPSASILCIGTPLTLTANGTTGTGSLTSYNWSGPNSFTTSTTAPATAFTTTTTLESGIYTVTVTYPGTGCTSAQKTTAVSVNAVPSLTSVSQSATVACAGSPLTFTANGSSGTGAVTSYNWTGPNSYSATTATANHTFTLSSTSESGIYSVTVSYVGAGCTSAFVATSPAVTVNAQPVIGGITPSATKLCTGTALTLAANGASGTGFFTSYNWTGPNGFSTTTASASTTFTPASTAASGPYSVSVTYSGSGCTSAKAATAAITVNTVPSLSGISATPGILCVGQALSLTASGTSGTGSLVSYNWSGPAGYSSTSATSAQSYTVPANTASGVYNATVTFEGTGCTSPIVSSSSITVHPRPSAFVVNGGGSYCALGTGIAVGLTGSEIGVDYQLYNGATLMGIPVAGGGSAISFGQQTMAGTYTAVGTNAVTGCNTAMTGSASVLITISPNVYTVTGGGTYCEGTGGFHIGVSSSDVSVSYQLYRDGIAVGGLVTGDGNPIDFGVQLIEGTYTVKANPGSGCETPMSGSGVIVMHPAPTVYNVSGGGTICQGDAGVHVNLSWSVTGINYQLYRGATTVGAPIAGTTSALDMGLVNVDGTYTILATNASTGCMSNMTGSAVVVVNPAPTAYTVTGGGTTCGGSGAVSVGLSGSDNDRTYQLYSGSTPVGSPVSGTTGAISFGAQDVSGVYSVLATNTITSCTGPMTGTVTVSINPAPVAYTVTGGGQYCSGSTGLTVGVAASNVGIMYQLYYNSSTQGSPIPGTGAAISFGTFTAAGTYSVLATNILNSCTGAMSGTATISINALPDVYNVTGGGPYCSGTGGAAVGLSFSATNINYQLYNGSTATGLPLAGNGGALSFGNQVSSGVYSVRATNSTTACTIDMSGTATVTENPLPTQYSVTGGGSFCTGGTGVAVGLSSSQSGVNYQLYNGVPTVGSPVAGNGSPLTFGMQGTAGTYTILGTNTATGCTNAMTSSATVVTNPLPSVYVVTGGGHYCENGAGVAVGLNNSNTGIEYQLYTGTTATGSPIAGTDLPISFGMQTVMGTYTVMATNTVTACSSNMFGSASVVIDPLPTAHNVTGTGSYCAGGAGLPVGLATSTIGISYQLYTGIVPVGGPFLGTNSAINFGTQTAGTYTVLGTNNVTGCTNAMAGNATVTANPLPTQFNVNGGGSYCQNGSGVLVGLIGSESGISYQLYNGATAMGGPVNGNGSAISFGSHTLAGTYTVLATNLTTLCTKPMTASATVIMNPAPTAYTVTGGGSYCIGGTGVNIGLSSSNIGITYRLYRGATQAGAQVDGTGASLDFGLQTVAGTYTVHATNNSTTCTNAMGGSANVIVNALPLAYNMTGGGGYCVGGTGVSVGLANTQTGVNYQLYRGTTLVGTAMAGTGAAVSFGSQMVAGVYSVQATNTTTGCVNGMSTTATVIINQLPVVYNVTGGGGYCVGGPGSHIGLQSSDPGVNYQLYLGASAIGAAMPGSGAGIDYGEVFVAGTYSVGATNSITGCVSPMTGSATVTINTPPSVFNVTGGGSYCSGSTGITVGLSGSQAGVNYTLYNGTTLTGTPVAGTGGTVSFGAQLFAGTYTVRATNATSGCVTSMTGSASVAVNALPSVYTINGGGSYCPGAGGVNIGLSGSTLGVTYQLYKGAVAIGAPVTGTGSLLSMGVYTTTGTYSALATVTLTGCMSNMTGSASVSQHALPDEYAVTGGGNYCSGSTGLAVGLSGSQSGVTYQLYNGSSMIGTFVGTGSALSFGLMIATGSFSVNAINSSTGCTRNMTGTATINVNALPTVYLTTGGGNYCSGGNGYTVVLNGSQTGIDYQLYRNGTPLTTTLSGTGSFLDFGLQTVAGFYTVKAVNSATGCMRTMAGSPEIVVHSLPTVFTVTGGGNYCAGGAGVEIGLSGSTSGVGYRLYNGSTPVGATVSGNGSVLTFGALPAAGVYTVQAVNSGTGCTNNMTGSATVAINALPAAYSVTGGGGYCSGGNGVAIGLSNSASGINYQLYKNGVATGSALSGTGSALNFGLKTATGVYTVMAVSSSTSCMNTMTGSTTVSINPAPATYIVTGGGSYCAGDAGVEIGVDGSETGVNYTLYNGSSVSGDVVAGTGAPISFGLHAAGMYTVMATNNSSTCQAEMIGGANISVNALPLSYVVTGGGAMCAGSAGVNISLSGSEPNMSYTLYNGSTATGTVVIGTGSGISFGLQAAAGTYSVLGTDMMTNCTNSMNGTATVSVNPAPAQYAVTGGGSYCAGGAGVTLSLTGSETGIQYNLYKNGVATGVSAMGTGAAVSFAPQFTNGNYTVMAVNNATSCTRAMTGSATVLVNTAPAAFTVAGGGGYCAGGTGVTITLGGSATGVAYKLYKGTTQVGNTIAGTGASLTFGLQQAAGVYTVQAISLANGCTTTMTGSATVIVNALPMAHAVTGGGSFCAGSTGVHVGLAASETGVTYKLYKGATMVGSSMSGTGGALDFGIMTNAGTYTVAATNSTTSCAAGMAGSAVVQVNALPVAQTVIGGGSYCVGGSGVDVALSNSQAGVNYQLYSGSSALGDAVAGTGNVLSFGMQTATGVYSVAAVNGTTSCALGMTGTVSVSTNALPTVFTVTGGGSYCAGGNGVNLSLSGSQSGVIYRVYRNGSQVGIETGTGATMNLGNQTAAGIYTVMAENATACTAAMAGSATISINTLPAVFAVSSGGAYCAGDAGVNVTLNGSEAGVMYRLYNGSTAVGGTVEGTGSSISFGMQTTGSFSVRATNAITSCAAPMTGTSVITMNTLPTAYTVTGGGGYCEGGNGVTVGLSSSQSGMSYQLYSGTTAVGPVKMGTGGTISFGAQLAGNFNVVAMNNSTGCTKTMNGSATVFTHDQPMAFEVMGGGSYCAGGNGVAVTLGGSQTGMNYRLYRGALAVSSLMAGTGSNINFGMQTTAGDYTVKATNATTGCSSVMTGDATISINALPQAFAVTGGGSYCAGGTGVAVGLAGSVDGMSYQLYMGTTAIGDAVAGNGTALDFGIRTAAGVYGVVATDNATGCTIDMSNTVAISINTLPVAYTLAGSSTGYCQGGTGVQLTLNNSQTGVSYRLYNGSSVSGGDVAGTNGNGLSFGMKTAEGTYSVLATNNTTGCTSVMTGTPSVVMNPLPSMFAINGGGSYCVGSEGVAVGLSGSQGGVNYQLYKGGVATTNIVEGNGSEISFGIQLAGNYTVRAMNATTGCRSNMTGTTSVVANALPATFAMTGGGQFCAGGEGVNVGLTNSASDIQYQLYNGTTAVGAAVNGNGGAMNFGMQTEPGIYTAKAMNTATGCGANMSSSATVIVNTIPEVQTVTGGGALCAGGAGVTVSLAGSATGVNYRLFKGSTAIGGVVAGNGGGIAFAPVTAAGTYSVLATTAANGCTKPMTGTATVIVNQLPAVFSVTGGGAYCEGGAGVAVAISGSESGVTYKLFQGSTPIATVSGNDNIVTFGPQIAAGTYTVQGTNTATSCVRNMNGSAAISITPSVLPVVTMASSAGDEVCAGTLVTYTTAQANGGTAPAYQWKVNGANAGTGTSSFSYIPANGDAVSVVMTSNANCAANNATATRTMTVNAKETPAVTVTASATGTLCMGAPVTFTAAALFGGDAPVFEWIKNGAVTASGTTLTYAPANGDVLSVRLTSNFACATAGLVNSENQTLTVLAPQAPSVVITANPGTKISKGQSVKLTAVVSNTFQATYQWYVNGAAVHNATSTTYTSADFNDQDTVTCRVANNTPCGEFASFNTVLINVSSVGVGTVPSTAFDVRLMPNPNKGNFAITGTIAGVGNEKVTIEVANMLGQIVYKTQADVRNGKIDTRVDLGSGLANGMYLLNLHTENDSRIFHITLQQ